VAETPDDGAPGRVGEGDEHPVELRQILCHAAKYRSTAIVSARAKCLAAQAITNRHRALAENAIRAGEGSGVGLRGPGVVALAEQVRVGAREAVTTAR
jgi:hypothetical protein